MMQRNDILSLEQQTGLKIIMNHEVNIIIKLNLKSQ